VVYLVLSRDDSDDSPPARLMTPFGKAVTEGRD
jgi:hypothetical protein